MSVINIDCLFWLVRTFFYARSSGVKTWLHYWHKSVWHLTSLFSIQSVVDADPVPDIAVAASAFVTIKLEFFWQFP